jgi:hypothetical protein
MVNSHRIGIDGDKWAEYVKEELEQVKIDREIIEGKIKLVSKEEIKENIGRSPDFADALMMRSYFDLKKPVAPSEDYSKSAQSFINSIDSSARRSMMGVDIDYRDYQPLTLDLLHTDRD